MRIGVDATSWFNGRGYGRYTRELLTALAAGFPEHSLVCLVDRRDVEAFDLAGEGVEVVGVKLGARPTDAATSDGRRGLLDMWRMTRALARLKVDVAFYPTVYTFFPVPRRLPAVVTIHDAITERFPHLTLPSRRARLFWRVKVRLALWQARLILTVSDFAAGELREVLGVKEERLRVSGEAPAAVYREGSTPEQVAEERERARIPAGANYFTYVGGFNPHKNVVGLVHAHARLVRGHDDPPHLALVGTLSSDVFHGGVDPIRRAIEAAGSSEYVHWTDFVPDERLRHLQAGARAVVLPSECEGFGLPAAEAAACGTPMIATRQSPLPELFEGAGIFVDPGNDRHLQNALRRLNEDDELRAKLGKRAAECAAKLSWHHAAERTLSALAEASTR